MDITSVKDATLPGRDHVTGLADHDHFRRALEHALAGPAGGAVIVLDLDRFHRVNACVGRAGGDAVLRALADRLCTACASCAVLAREYANRFLFLFEGPQVQASDAADALLGALAAPFGQNGAVLYLSASIGVARFPEHGLAADDVMAALDHALVEAKRARPGAVRDGILIGNRAREHAHLAAALRDAIDNDRIEVHYQPQVALASGRICGAEALVRWDDPTVGAVSADTIVRVAEEVGLIAQLGERVLRMACAQAQAWRAMGFGELRVAVNLSARQVRLRSLERMVLDALAQTGLPPACLDLELTESVVMDDIAQAALCLQSLKAHGVRLSLDDFGTGYSSLAYLSALPIDTLKIDRSFLELVPGSERATGLVGTIVASAHSLGIRVVAEGVEYEAQLRFLARSGCDEIQGYYFSKPLPAAQFTAMLATGHTLPDWLRRQALRAPTILVVDGDRNRRCALGALAAQLLEWGGRIVYTASAAEAIRMCSEAPDLVLVAPRLVDMPSAAFLRIVRQTCPAAARVLLADGLSAVDGAPAEQEPAETTIAWPGGRRALLEHMRDTLARRTCDSASQNRRLRPGPPSR